jgi:hypothetical protein
MVKQRKLTSSTCLVLLLGIISLKFPKLHWQILQFVTPEKSKYFQLGQVHN